MTWRQTRFFHLNHDLLDSISTYGALKSGALPCASAIGTSHVFYTTVTTVGQCNVVVIYTKRRRNDITCCQVQHRTFDQHCNRHMLGNFLVFLFSCLHRCMPPLCMPPLCMRFETPWVFPLKQFPPLTSLASGVHRQTSFCRRHEPHGKGVHAVGECHPSGCCR